MEKILLNINETVPATIFEDRDIKRVITNLFKVKNETIKKRYNVIKNSFEQKEIRNIKFTTIRDLFKGYFINKVINEAIINLFDENAKCTLKKSILCCLTLESLYESIYGDEMISAFRKAIETLPGAATFIRGQAIVLLKNNFSGYNPYSRKLKKANYCPECGCYCRCDANCEGDIKKCTSQHAKNCNHHCDCWILPFSEKRRMEEGDRVISTGKNN